MEYTRWYDKDINLKALMQLLESLSDEEKLIITSDILQVLMMNYSPDTDNLIEELDGQYIPIRRRWYDSLKHFIRRWKFSELRICKNAEKLSTKFSKQCLNL
jgi:hypothetical protein